MVEYKCDNNVDDRQSHDQIQEQRMASKALYFSSSSLDEEKICARDERKFVESFRQTGADLLRLYI